MTRSFDHLLKPMKLRRKKVKNRLAFGAHVTNFCDDGVPGERHRAYYAARARGGVGLIVVDPLPVHVSSQIHRAGLRPDGEGLVSALSRIVEAGRAEGAVMVLQLMHSGAHGNSAVAFAPAWSPSGLPSQRDCDGSHAMTEEEILELIDAYADAAKKAQQAGFDGIELAAGGNVLVDQFWSRLSNRRQDRWGGSFENRLRFSAEIQRRIRREVGAEFLIGMFVSSDPAVPGALSLVELGRIAAWHEAHGVLDYVSVGTGSYFSPAALSPGQLSPGLSAAAVKSAVSRLPVAAAGGLHDVGQANSLIADGHADLVVLVRPLIADPKLPIKLAENRSDDVRPCIACNQLCLGRRNRDYWISCLVNPGAGRELDREKMDQRMTDQPKQVLVVGGGLAGLEAARVAAARGHHVQLVEARDHFGGQFALAGRQPGRERLSELVDWFESQLLKQQVRLRLETRLEAQDVIDMSPDVVILATGSLPTGTGFQRAIAFQTMLPGVDSQDVASVEAVLSGDTSWVPLGKPAAEGKRLLLLDDDGHWAGLGTALFLAEKGHEVTIASRHAITAFELMGEGEFDLIRRRLKEQGIKEQAAVALTGWRQGEASLRCLQSGRTWCESYDGLVLATTNRANDQLEQELLLHDLAAYGIDCRVVGDAAGPRRAHMAVFEGRQAVLDL